MRLIKKILYFIFSNAIALYLASLFIGGFSFLGGVADLVLAAVALTLINFLIKPILKLLLGPLLLLTLGFGIILINALVLYFLDILFDSLTIQGIVPLLIGTLVVGAVNTLLHYMSKNRES